MRIRVHKSSLSGRFRLPGDKSIAHRALMIAALGTGESVLQNLSVNKDIGATLSVLRLLGVRVDIQRDVATIHGVGRAFNVPTTALDCDESGTTLRLLSGLLVDARVGARLVGKPSLMRRPMRRIVDPLRARGGLISGTGISGDPELFAPISIAPLVGDEQISGLEAQLDVASAQVKSALLLSGLFADGRTVVQEPSKSRDHTERLLGAVGFRIQSAGSIVSVEPWHLGALWPGFETRLPGDTSTMSALLATCLTAGGAAEFEDVGLNPTRTGFLEVVRQLGALVHAVPRGVTSIGEPVGTVGVRASGALRAFEVGGELTVRSIDELPVLAAIATRCEGRSIVRDAKELRYKETDRIDQVVRLLSGFGVDVVGFADGFQVQGGTVRGGETLDVGGDHRMAMMAIAIAMRADTPTELVGVESLAKSAPEFIPLLVRAGARIEELD